MTPDQLQRAAAAMIKAKAPAVMAQADQRFARAREEGDTSAQAEWEAVIGSYGRLLALAESRWPDVAPAPLPDTR